MKLNNKQEEALEAINKLIREVQDTGDMKEPIKGISKTIGQTSLPDDVKTTIEVCLHRILSVLIYS